LGVLSNTVANVSLGHRKVRARKDWAVVAAASALFA
jgi:hypothetical protein